MKGKYKISNNKMQKKILKQNKYKKRLEFQIYVMKFIYVLKEIMQLVWVKTLSGK